MKQKDVFWDEPYWADDEPADSPEWEGVEEDLEEILEQGWDE